MKKFFSAHWITLVIGLSFAISTILAIRNNYIIEENHLIQKQTELVKQRTRDILTQTMHGLDLGLRGYGLTADEQLLVPYREAISETAGNLRIIDSLLQVQNYADREELQDVAREIDRYIAFCKEMVVFVHDGQMDEFNLRMKEDRGYKVWATYTKFADPLFKFENERNDKAMKDYQAAIRSNLVIQVLLLILVMPMIYVFVSKVNNERKRREALLKEVDDTDRTYVFNVGDLKDDATDINKRSIAHVKRASEFIAAIANGNYEMEWQGLTAENKAKNTKTLAGNLLHLRDRLKTVKRDDERRNWSNEGLAKFLEIVRNNQHDTETLSVKSISFLTKLIDGQQGSLFLAEDDNGEVCLNLAACYAFNKRKFVEKRIEIGSGLLGQAYLEKDPVFLKQIPKGYTSITSGLGEATPTCLVIIPMKHDDQVVAVAEFATFHELESYHIEFLSNAGEYFASAIISSRATVKMKRLLDDANVRELEMKQREEELRQNMEELQATQEELVRRQNEVIMQRSA